MVCQSRLLRTTTTLASGPVPCTRTRNLPGARVTWIDSPIGWLSISTSKITRSPVVATVRRFHSELHNPPRVFRLAQKKDLEPLHLLRPGDHAMQVRFRVLPKGEEAATAAPTATPSLPSHGYSPGTMSPGMMPGMMGPGMMGPGMMPPGMMPGSPIPARDRVTVNRVDLRLEGQAE